jgi:2-haloalkanoic acid dehalogenase type II
MKLSDFDALSFDCYGTLIDWETGIDRYLQQLQPEDGAAISLEALLETYAGKESEAERDFPAERYPDILARSFRETGAAHGVTVSDEFAAAFGASVPEWPAFPDSAEALDRLSRRFKLIILSNVDRASFARSNEKLGVTFDAVLTAEDIGSYKPDPRNFDALLKRIGEMEIPRSRLLHVAQSLFHDHVPAKAIGLPTVWIDRRHDRSGSGATPDVPAGVSPDWTFHSMKEFADAVDAVP